MPWPAAERWGHGRAGVGGGLAAPGWAFDPVNTWWGGRSHSWGGQDCCRAGNSGNLCSYEKAVAASKGCQVHLPRDKAVNLFRTGAAGPAPAPAVGEVSIHARRPQSLRERGPLQSRLRVLPTRCSLTLRALPPPSPGLTCHSPWARTHDPWPLADV